MSFLGSRNKGNSKKLRAPSVRQEEEETRDKSTGSTSTRASHQYTSRNENLPKYANYRWFLPPRKLNPTRSTQGPEASLTPEWKHFHINPVLCDHVFIHQQQRAEKRVISFLQGAAYQEPGNSSFHNLCMHLGKPVTPLDDDNSTYIMGRYSLPDTIPDYARCGAKTCGNMLLDEDGYIDLPGTSILAKYSMVNGKEEYHYLHAKCASDMEEIAAANSHPIPLSLVFITREQDRAAMQERHDYYAALEEAKKKTQASSSSIELPKDNDRSSIMSGDTLQADNRSILSGMSDLTLQNTQDDGRWDYGQGKKGKKGK